MAAPNASARHPHYKWADTPSLVHITVDLPGLEKNTVRIKLSPDGLCTLEAKAAGHSYQLKWQFLDKIRAEDSRWEIRERDVILRVQKLSPLPWKSLQLSSIPKPAYERVDWDRMQLASGDSDSESSEDEKEETEDDILASALQGGSQREGKRNRHQHQDTDKTAARQGALVSTVSRWVGLVWRSSDLLDFFLLVVVSLHVLFAPFTKVEESFNLQATHDLLYHHVHLDSYDHLEFPGVVPRTFLGPLLLAAVALPFKCLFQLVGLPKLVTLYTVRLLLGWMVVGAFSAFRKEVATRFGATAGALLIVLTGFQFHLPFYMSRTLPNTFALALACLAYRYWFQERHLRTTSIAVFTAAVFRSEVALLFGPMLLEAILKRRVGLWRVVKTGLASLLFSITLSVAVDSLFWRRLVWPEGEVFYFNTILNKSGEWGVSPYHWYFTSALPRALLGCLVFIPLAIYWERRSITILRPVAIFLVVYSFLPHKELRFIFYVIPLLNAVGAIGLGRVIHDRKKRPLLFYLSLGMAMVMVVATMGFTIAAHWNYPGATALLRLHSLHHSQNNSRVASVPHVHIDEAAAMTGISRFLERNEWRYSKEEKLTDYSPFDYLLRGNSSAPDGFEIWDRIKAFEGVQFRPADNSWLPVQFVASPRMYIMRKEA